MLFTRFLALGTLTVLGTTTTQASPAFRANQQAFASKTFTWVVDPHAADPCTAEPGCHNSVKYGYNVLPMNISADTNVVFQEAKRPKGLAAVLNLNIYTQPGCIVSACHMIKSFFFFTKEECVNDFASKTSTEPDGKTAKLEFGGIYYENLPAGELYTKFEKKNYLTNKNTCTYEMRDGFQRWF